MHLLSAHSCVVPVVKKNKVITKSKIIFTWKSSLIRKKNVKELYNVRGSKLLIYHKSDRLCPEK